VKLREYQERAITDLRAQYSAGKRAPVLVLPTGGGKTVIAAAIVRGAIERGNRVLFLAHRSELLDQTINKLEQAGIHNVRLVRAAVTRGPNDAAITVASIPTLARRTDLPKADLVVFDECHHVVAKTWARIADAYRSSRLLGMTATPQRSDGQSLGDIFDSIVVGSTVQELTALGYLVPCRVWAPSGSTNSGEIAISPADAYTKYTPGKRAVIFCVTVEHAERVAAEMPVPCGVVHGDMPAGERARTLARLKSGELLAVANVHVLTEGWDMPEVEVCIMTRKPDHSATYLKCIGRVLSPAPGKEQAILLDLGGSVWTHGVPDSAREYTLDGEGIKADTEREPIRQCPTCGSVFLAPADGMCPQCGVQMPAAKRKAPVSNDQGITEIKDRPTPSDTLMANLLEAARRTRRSAEWAQRAHVAIQQQQFAWRKHG
jgi:DNA repair protein RadD